MPTAARPLGPLGRARRSVEVPEHARLVSRARDFVARPPAHAPRPIAQPRDPSFGSLLPYVTLATPQNSRVVIDSIVELTNTVRAENGLPALAANEPLMAAAQLHSQEMATASNMAHTLPGSSLPTLTDRAAAVHYRYSSLGENIAYNQADASSVVASWMNSRAHRHNMLGAAFTDIGVGLAWNSRGEPYYTMMLGRQG